MSSMHPCAASSVAVLIVVLGAGGALAAKPTPQPLTGTIYASSDTYYSMNASGGSRVALPAGVVGNPSTLLHGGHRWFLTVRAAGEPNCDGTQASQLFAVRGDGDESYTVQLTDNTTFLELAIGPYAADSGAVAEWKASDTEVSFTAIQIDPVTCDGVESGFYVARIAWDSSGNVVGLEAMPISPVFALPVVPEVPPENRPGPNISRGTTASWSPDGTQFAYGDGLGVRVVTLATGANEVVVPGGFWVQWSPAGNRLAYTRDMQVETCDVNGGNVLRHPWDRFRTIRTEEAFWSPTGTHLVMRRLTKDRAGSRIVAVDVYRTTATFTDGTNLTGDTDAYFSPRKWVP